MLTALLRAFAQLDDPAFLGMLARSVAWAAACFALLLAGSVWGVQHCLAAAGWWSWLAGLLGGAAAALLAFWLFLPVAVGIGTLFVERIAAAVEHRFYPGLPASRGASLTAQAADALAVGARVLLLSLGALLLAVVVPGVGLLLGWAISGYAIGRGLFVAVAMRRMSRAEAAALHRRRRAAVLGIGLLLASAGFLPPLNLLIPVLGTAAMVHLLHGGLAVPRDAREIGSQ